MDNHKKALENMRYMFDLVEKVTAGEISQEEAVQKILAITSESTLDGLDAVRKQADDVALAYAAGDFDSLPAILDEWVNGTVSISRAILLQIQNAKEFGLDGKGGL